MECNIRSIMVRSPNGLLYGEGMSGYGAPDATAAEKSSKMRSGGVSVKSQIAADAEF